MSATADDRVLWQDEEGEGGEEGRRKRRRKRRRDRSLELDDEDFDLLEEQGIKVGTAAKLEFFRPSRFVEHKLR